VSEIPGTLWTYLGCLLLASGFFSSSETALFSLSRAQRLNASPAVQAILARPRRLLLTILLCNLLVNVTFFAFSSRLLPGDKGRKDFLVGLAALVLVLVFGEILPKTIGLRARSGVARLSSPILLVLSTLMTPLSAPVIRLLDRIHARLSRVLGEERRVTPEILTRVMERGAQDGHLLDTEADLLAEIIELDEIRVREIMTPRVDALFVDVSGNDRDEAIRRALERRQSWLPVIDGNPDKVVGRVRVTELVRHPDWSLRRLVMPVKFVPEVASALDLLRNLRRDRTSEAVVVDEWGGTAGFVEAEDVFEEIVGDLRAEGEERVPAVVPLGEGRFRVAGSLSIRDWNEAFGLSVVPIEFETVGGFVTALLGRIPRTGDRVRSGNLELLVHEVRGRRVLTVELEAKEPGEGLRPGVEVREMVS